MCGKSQIFGENSCIFYVDSRQILDKNADKSPRGIKSVADSHLSPIVSICFVWTFITQSIYLVWSRMICPLFYYSNQNVNKIISFKSVGILMCVLLWAVFFCFSFQFKIMNDCLLSHSSPKKLLPWRLSTFTFFIYLCLYFQFPFILNLNVYVYWTCALDHLPF